jgi:hypothetical protein
MSSAEHAEEGGEEYTTTTFFTYPPRGDDAMDAAPGVPVAGEGKPDQPDEEEEEEEEEELCRYCFDGPEEGTMLSGICACTGGQKHVHLDCLRRWQRMVLVSQPTHPAFYQDDVRHHTCNVCAAAFNIPPPTRLELMRTFTGAEIAALISEGCIIASHRVFSDELERQLRAMPHGGALHVESS